MFNVCIEHEQEIINGNKRLLSLVGQNLTKNH